MPNDDRMDVSNSFLLNQILRLSERLATLERLVWIAVGGTTVLSALMVWGLNFLSEKLK
jgi:hypothetical protein